MRALPTLSALYLVYGYRLRYACHEPGRGHVRLKWRDHVNGFAPVLFR